MSKALILVDIQNDYFTGGKMPLVGMEHALKKAQKILSTCRSASLPIYHIQHIAIRKEATFFLKDTHGVEIHSAITPLDNEIVIQKNYPNSFRDTTLQEHLRIKDIKELIIIGAMSHMCIDATTRAAFDLHYQCTVLSDACATRDLQFGDEHVPANFVHASFMSALNNTYAKVLKTEAWGL